MKTIKTISLILTVGFLIVGAYLLGTANAVSITEYHVGSQTREIVPDGYISLDECIPLKDIACYFIDGNGYPCFELKDVGNQFDNVNNYSYQDIMENLEDKTEYFQNNYLDMRRVMDWKVTDNGLRLYCEDGIGYYWKNRN